MDVAHHLRATATKKSSKHVRYQETRLTALWFVVLPLAVPVSDALDPVARVQHVNREVVVVHARRCGVDAREPGVLAAIAVGLIHTGTLAAVATIVA